MENELADVGRDGRTRLQIIRRERGQGNINLPVQLTTSNIGNLTRLIYTLLYVMTIQTYIHPVDPYSAACDDHTYIHIIYWCTLPTTAEQYRGRVSPVQYQQ